MTNTSNGGACNNTSNLKIEGGNGSCVATSSLALVKSSPPRTRPKGLDSALFDKVSGEVGCVFVLVITD